MTRSPASTPPNTPPPAVASPDPARKNRNLHRTDGRGRVPDDPLMRLTAAGEEAPTKVAPAHVVEALREATRDADATQQFSRDKHPRPIAAEVPRAAARSSVRMRAEADDEPDDETTTYEPEEATQAYAALLDPGELTHTALDAKLSPKWVRAMARGQRRLEAGQLIRATWSFHRACNIAPDYPDGFAALGTAWLELRRPRRAMLAFHRAIELAPHDQTLHEKLSAAHDLLNMQRRRFF